MTPINPYPAAHAYAAKVAGWLHSPDDAADRFRAIYSNLADYLLEHVDEWFMTDEPNADLINDFIGSLATTDEEYAKGSARRRSARYHQLISIDADLLTTPQLNDLLSGRNVFGEES